jgi:hypothetical protein
LGINLPIENSIHEEIEARECLLTFRVESFALQFAIQKYKVAINRTVILHDVLYGCETLFLTISEEHKLRVFENRVLRKIFGPKKYEVSSEWKRLHNDEVYDLHFSPKWQRRDADPSPPSSAEV